MTDTASADSDPIVARLRAAGCVFAEEEAEILREAAGTPEELEQLVERRAAGFPLEPLVGWAEFAGLRVSVEPGVFVPRRRTEYLVHAARPLLEPGMTVVDLCCGTGAIGAALAASVPDLRVYAADIEPAAVRCARRTLAPYGGMVFEGDLFDALPAELRGGIDVLAVNAPYVPTDAIGLMPREAREYEPLVTLDGGGDGLDVQRRVIADAPQWLRPGGSVLVETSAEQAAGTTALMVRAGLHPRILNARELYATVVVGTLSGPPRPTEPRPAGR